MLRPWLSLVWLLLTTGCPEPVETCRRSVIDRRGQLGSLTPQPLALAVVGDPVEVTVFAPLSSCVSDELAVRARLFDPENLEVAVELIEPPRVGFNGVVTARFRFTPSRDGAFTLETGFEPSLGVRNTTVFVAADGAAAPFVRVPRPSGCDFAWPLADTVIACELLDAGLSLVRADGGLTAFEGTDLVVAGDVLWSVHQGNLERRRFEGDVLVRTHLFPGFVPGGPPAVHSESAALRPTADRRLGLVQLFDGGVRQSSFPRPPELISELLFADESDSYIAWGGRACGTNGDCSPQPPLLGLEPEASWIINGTMVEAWTRPWPGRPLQSLLVERVIPSIETRHVERVPVWLDVAFSGVRTPLLSLREGGVAFTAWVRGDVLRVGQRHVLVRDSAPNVVRLYALSL